MPKVKRLVVDKHHVSQNSRHAVPNERAEAAREEFRKQISQYSLEQLVFCDESIMTPAEFLNRYVIVPIAFDTSAFMAGRDPALWDKFVLATCLSVQGYMLGEVFEKEDEWDAQAFENWLLELVMPLMNPFPGPKSVLILDKCPEHREKEIRAICESRGTKYHILPSGSQAMNPLAKAFKRLKSELRKRDYVSCHDDPELFPGAVLEALQKSMTPEIALECFKECGYHETIVTETSETPGNENEGVEQVSSDPESDKENVVEESKVSKTKKPAKKKRKTSRR